MADWNAPEPARRPRLSRTVLALGTVSLFTDLSSEMIVPLLPAFLTTLGAGPGFVGVLDGVAAATVALLKLVSGVLADRAPRRKPLIVLGYTLSSAMRPLVALAVAPWQVLVVRFLDRVGKGVRGSPRDALIADVTPPADRGRAYGVNRAFDHCGALLGLLLAWWLLDSGQSLRTVFWIAAVPAGLAVLVLVFFVREGRRSRTAAPRTITWRPPPIPALRRYLIVLGVFTLAGGSDLLLVLRAGDLGVPIAQLPLLWAAMHLVKAVLSTPLGSWSDNRGRRPIIAGGFLVFAVTYAGLAAATQPWHAWALFAVHGVFFALTEGAERAFVADLAPPDARGRAFGAFHVVTGLAALPGAALFGAIWEFAGAPVAFGVGAALAALAAALLLVIVPARMSNDG